MSALSPLHGALMGVAPVWAALLGVLFVLFALGFTGAPLWAWVGAGLVALVGFGAPLWAIGPFLGLALVFLLPPVRRLLSAGVLRILRAADFLPEISDTEREAIDAGTVWVEGELFSGKPDARRLLAADYAGLSPEEQAFLDGPVEEVCRMTIDWEVWQRRDLPPEVWAYLKKERFFGLIIPKEYGGHGFSPSANSAVVAKTSSASSTLGITVMVPNSLGPAELLIHYGTQEQKDRYLPRLARGEDIPAFALTESGAGSDAGAVTSNGVVFRGDDGELYLRLNWSKRYITLAAVSTVLGLAFQLEDPHELLGKGKHPGITAALVPTSAPGVRLGRRHDPLGVPFWNCPTDGEDVVVPLEDAVIGGAAGVGKGWRMLMQSLAAGRGISLPASAAGGIKAVTRVASAHAAVRKQFGLPIGKFEGIEEPLARMGGWSYLVEAARRYTNGGLDAGAKPAVVTAMMKYHTTELFRKATNDAMDVLGGNAISRGPRNALASAYIGLPVSITVEGANILTRTLIIFGQGAIRCHPYALKEMLAAAEGDVRAFDAAFWPHVGHVVRNAFRSVLLSATRGRLGSSPVAGEAAVYWKKLAWSSASFAILADIAMGTLGGDLKRREKLTGRFADVFSWMFLATTVLRRWEAEGRRPEDRAFFHWSMAYAFSQMQAGFDGLFENMRVPGLTWLFRGPLAAWSRINRFAGPPSDVLVHRVAAALQVPGEQRERLLSGVFVPTTTDRPLGRLEHALVVCTAGDAVAKRLREAVRAGRVTAGSPAAVVAAAVEAGVIGAGDAALLERSEAARADAIAVDSFELADFFQSAVTEAEAPSGDGAIGSPHVAGR